MIQTTINGYNRNFGDSPERKKTIQGLTLNRNVR